MPKVGIIVNDSKPIAQRAAEEIQTWLDKRGWQAVLTSGMGGILGCDEPGVPIRHTPVENLVPEGFDQTLNFAVSLGGDGTVLSSFRQIAPCGIPLLAINTGHMGFLTEAYLMQWEDALTQAISGEYIVEQRSMMTVQVYSAKKLLWEALSLNEMVIHREPLTSMCHFEITIGRHSAVDVAADGVIISTPTGSTAYALSAGGACN